MPDDKDGRLTSYAKELRQRFGDGCGPDGDGLPELPFIRQVLAARPCAPTPAKCRPMACSTCSVPQR